MLDDSFRGKQNSEITAAAHSGSCYAQFSVPHVDLPHHKRPISLLEGKCVGPVLKNHCVSPPPVH